jgi:hypothetical protein
MSHSDPCGSRCLTLRAGLARKAACLVDADFPATEQFMSPDCAADRPCATIGLTALLEGLDKYLHELQDSACDTSVDHRRREVLAACRVKAKLPPGLFLVRLACERQFEIIGEALTRLRDRHPDAFAKIPEGHAIIAFGSFTGTTRWIQRWSEK